MICDNDDLDFDNIENLPNEDDIEIDEFESKDEDIELDEIEAEKDEEKDDEESTRRDITSYRTTKEIWQSGLFTSEERRREYRRRGKSPSGFIDGVYNDFNLDDGEIYNDFNRDWDADA